MNGEEQQERILTLLDHGLSARAAAREIGGISHKAVIKTALNSGYEISGQHLIKTEKKEKAIDLLQQRPDAAFAAQQIGGIKMAAIKQIARTAGISLLKRPRVSAEKKEKIIAAVQNGLSTRGAAKAVGGTNYETVRRVAKKSGITLPTQAEGIHRAWLRKKRNEAAELGRLPGKPPSPEAIKYLTERLIHDPKFVAEVVAANESQPGFTVQSAFKAKVDEATRESNARMVADSATEVARIARWRALWPLLSRQKPISRIIIKTAERNDLPRKEKSLSAQPA